jgi:DNA repair protein RadC
VLYPGGAPVSDLRLTRQLADAARLLDVNLHDHIIVGNGTEAWVSLAERGLI